MLRPAGKPGVDTHPVTKPSLVNVIGVIATLWFRTKGPEPTSAKFDGASGLIVILIVAFVEP